MWLTNTFTRQAKTMSDVTLLVLARFDYDELITSYPEQHDLIITNVLAYYELDKDGNDLGFYSPDEEAFAMGNAYHDEKQRVKGIIQAAVKKRNAGWGGH